VSVTDPDAPDPARYAAAMALLHEHLEGSVANEPWVQTVEFDETIPRWYVRFGCDGRDAATIYFDLHQRSLHHEVYFLPDPHYRHEDIYRLLLKANHQAYGTRASIAPDGELYLTGRTLIEHLDAAELDRLIGSIYEYTERWFPIVVRLAFQAPAPPPT
jgi:hypothetical protein